jgi:hypothetical protein
MPASQRSLCTETQHGQRYANDEIYPPLIKAGLNGLAGEKIAIACLSLLPFLLPGVFTKRSVGLHCIRGIPGLPMKCRQRRLTAQPSLAIWRERAIFREMKAADQCAS